MESNSSGRKMSIMLALMSLCAILISFFTLNEMKKQRKLSLEQWQKSQEPNLYIEEIKPFAISYEVECDSCAYVHSVSSSSFDENFTILNVINVGNGNAVNVKVKWEADFDQFKQKLNAYNVDSTNLKFVNDDTNISFDYKAFGGSGSSSFSLMDENHSYILSTTSGADGYRFRIPYHLLQLSAIAGNAYVNYLEDYSKYDADELLTNHLMTLSYNGTDGRSYVKEFKVQVQMFYVIQSATINGETLYSISNRKGVAIGVKEII